MQLGKCFSNVDRHHGVPIVNTTCDNPAKVDAKVHLSTSFSQPLLLACLEPVNTTSDNTTQK